MGKQWRLSWDMWPHEWPRASRTEKVHTDYETMMSQLKGLRGMEADHPPRPCHGHVWNIRVEEQETSEWKEAAPDAR
jgi:hypothetical protein